MTHGSLFTGIGGFDLGFERAGMQTVWQVESDAKAQETLVSHFEKVERFEDVRDCKGLRSVDVVSGGFPCQDLSVAGRREGLAGERSGLWFEFARILEELRPRWVVIENVPGLLSSRTGRDFAVILRRLVELGYGVSWRVLDAQYFGVAQRRRRVFIIGSLGNYSCCQVLFESEGLSGNPAPSRETGKEVAYSLRANPSHSGDKGDGGINTTLVAHTLRSRECKPGGSMPGRGGEDDFNVIATGWDIERCRIHDSRGVSPTLAAQEGRGHGVPTIAVVEQNNVSSTPAKPSLRASETPNFAIVNCLDGAQGGPDDNAAQAGQLVLSVSENQRGELRTSEVAAQLTSGGGKPGQGYPAVTGQFGVRRLTPTECERLQGFPDGWTGMHKDTVRYRQIGNAVAVPVAEWIGKQIVRVN